MKKKKLKTLEAPMVEEPKYKRKGVDIHEAENGYIVTGRDHNYNEIKHIAKTKAEAHRHARKHLGMSQGPKIKTEIGVG